MSKDLYSKIVCIVRDRKQDGDLFIDRDEIIDEVISSGVLSHESRGDLERNVAAMYASIALNSEKCFSYKRRKGKYINLEQCDSPKILKKIMGNTKMDIKAHGATWQRLLQQLKLLQAQTVPGQYRLDPEASDAPIIDETFEELVERLMSA